MIISLIAAMAKNHVIGSANKLPWHLPEDLKFFKDKTKGHIIIMGRKTFESVGSKPLPGRLNIIVSRQASTLGPATDTLRFCPDLDSALSFCETQTAKWGTEIFICGGGEIYQQSLPIADRLYVTMIDREVEGDAYFPKWDEREFQVVARDERTTPERFAFVTLERVQGEPPRGQA